MESSALLVATDVDGTLLGPGESAAIAACRALAQRTPVILASSRTVAELARLQGSWGLGGPVIAENGGAIALLPDDPLGAHLPGLPSVTETSDGPRHVHHLAPPLTMLAEAIARLDLDERAAWAAAVAEATGALDAEAVARWHSVLVPMSVATPVVRRLVSAGLRAEPGGRWLQIATGGTKGAALERLAAAWAACHGRAPITWAIGDDANDTSMLAAADRGWAIRRPERGHLPALLAIASVTALEEAGPAGWPVMAAAALAQLAGGP